MGKWIFSTQSNVVVVAVAYACSLFFIGETQFEVKEPIGTPTPPYVSPAKSSLLVGEELEKAVKFQSLRARWHTERGATSSITKMAHCDAYIGIIAMGKPVIPLIMSQLRSEGDQPDQWFWALQVLTDDFDPVAEDDRGNTAKMAQAWLDWWSDNPDYAG